MKAESTPSLSWFPSLLHYRGHYEIIRAQYGHKVIALPWEFGHYLYENDKDLIVIYATWTGPGVMLWQVLLPSMFLWPVKLKAKDGAWLLPSPEYQQEYDEVFSWLLSTYIAWSLAREA